MRSHCISIRISLIFFWSFVWTVVGVSLQLCVRVKVMGSFWRAVILMMVTWVFLNYMGWMNILISVELLLKYLFRLVDSVQNGFTLCNPFCSFYKLLANRWTLNPTQVLWKTDLIIKDWPLTKLSPSRMCTHLC